MSELAQTDLTHKQFEKGGLILREGEAGEEAYLIEQGSVRVFCMVDGRRFDIGVLKAGSVLGEMALIDSGGRMASAVAEEKTLLRVIPRRAIEAELRRAEPLVRAVLTTLVHNVRALNARTLAARSAVRPEAGP